MKRKTCGMERMERKVYGTKRMKRKIAAAAAFAVLACSLSGCGRITGQRDGNASSAETSSAYEKTEEGQPEGTDKGPAGTETRPEGAGSQPSGTETPPADAKTRPEGDESQPANTAGSTGSRRESPFSGASDTLTAGTGATVAKPDVAPYTVNADLSNIDNLWQYYLSDDFRRMLAQNQFVVESYAGDEFFEIYEQNRYDQKANFITVDSLMHTYHLYFSFLMKNIERDYLSDRLTRLSRRMCDSGTALYEKAKGSEWEDAAGRAAAFFAVGLKLLDDSAETHPDVRQAVDAEVNAIMSASGSSVSAVTGLPEDYTQYIPRGYYEGDAELERYFRAMMWYGRVHFKQADETLDRCALLITLLASRDAESYDLWKSIYDVTSFFAGSSDDAGLDEYVPLLEEIYGASVTADTLLADSDGFARFHRASALLPPPEIGGSPEPGFRFMGQRVTVDAAIMQNLIYDSVGENRSGAVRSLPDVLDVPAALGSDTALDILRENGSADFKGYPEQMDMLRGALSKDDETMWTASLYAGWLHTLRPLLEVKGEGYPMFMRGELWAKKDLECFAGSYTELKHDTVLYTKQVMAEMGDSEPEQEPDDRGYAEPEPLVYARFSSLARRTAEGLGHYQMIEKSAEEDLLRLAEMADILTEISEKELRDETLTDEEYEFIRTYGGSLEHFWMETLKDFEEKQGYVSTSDCPAAVVVDIATDPNGYVQELATDVPSLITVIVKVDGKLKIAQGSVYTFYQFAWPANDRLTDSKWRMMRGRAVDENYEPAEVIDFEQPEWTRGYRYEPRLD